MKPLKEWHAVFGVMTAIKISVFQSISPTVAPFLSIIYHLCHTAIQHIVPVFIQLNHINFVLTLFWNFKYSNLN